MGLFDFLKRKKKKEEAEAEAEQVMELDDSELQGIEPPETRFTDEYKEYLASLEKAEYDTPEDEAPEDEAPEDEAGD